MISSRRVAEQTGAILYRWPYSGADGRRPLPAASVEGAAASRSLPAAAAAANRCDWSPANTSPWRLRRPIQVVVRSLLSSAVSLCSLDGSDDLAFRYLENQLHRHPQHIGDHFYALNITAVPILSDKIKSVDNITVIKQCRKVERLETELRRSLEGLKLYKSYKYSLIGA